MKRVTSAVARERFWTLPLPYTVSTVEHACTIMPIQRIVILRFVTLAGYPRFYMFDEGEVITPKLRRALADEGAV